MLNCFTCDILLSFCLKSGFFSRAILKDFEFARLLFLIPEQQTRNPSKSLKKPLLRQKGDNIPSTGKVIQHLFNIVYRLIFSGVLL